MHNLDLSTLPSQYRAIAKRYAAIEKALENLPEPWPDFTGLTPHERDCVELYLHCLFIAHNDELSLGNRKQWAPAKEALIDHPRLNQILSENMLQEDQALALSLLNKVPWRITKNQKNFLYREKRPALMKYFLEQKTYSDWLPDGPFHEDNLTWIAWDELIKLVEKYGYDCLHDNVSELVPISEWDMKAKDSIFHLLLEMIDPEKVQDVWTEKMGRDLNDLVGLRHRRRSF